MKKPDRVEVGQWWVPRFGGQAPDRVTPDTVAALCAFQSELTHWIDARDYLGSGEHPEPSEWMIETLVNAMSEIENGGPAFDEPSRGRFDRTNYRKIVRDAIDGKSHDLTYTRCVGVIYRLLRSLGKW